MKALIFTSHNPFGDSLKAYKVIREDEGDHPSYIVEDTLLNGSVVYSRFPKSGVDGEKIKLVTSAES